MKDTAVHQEFRSISERADAYHELAKLSALPLVDARNDFFLQAGNQLRFYAASLGFEIAASKLIGRPTGDEIADMMVELLGLPMEYSSHAYTRSPTLDMIRQKHRRLLYIDTWCAFEHGLRSIYRALVSATDQQADLGRSKHVSVYKVWNRVLVLCTPRAEVERHWDTFDFCAAARNTIHSNTLYEGKRRQLQLTEYRSISLIKDQITKFHTGVDLPLLIERLVEIGKALRSTLIRFDRVIPTLTAGKETPLE